MLTEKQRELKRLKNRRYYEKHKKAVNSRRYKRNRENKKAKDPIGYIVQVKGSFETFYPYEEVKSQGEFKILVTFRQQYHHILEEQPELYNVFKVVRSRKFSQVPHEEDQTIN